MLMKSFWNKYVELLIWCGGLLALALMNPEASDGFSLCLLHQLGIPWCPGCGLGHSISFLLHANFQASFQSHPLGFPAFMILLGRIFILIKFHFSPSKINTPWNPTVNHQA